MTRSEDGTLAAPRSARRHPHTRTAKGGAWGDALRDRLRALLDAEHLSQRAFAARCGVTPSRVTEWLAGAQLPSAESLGQIADGLGVCLNWLLCGDGAAGPVYRGQSRTRAGLEDDLAAHVAHTVAARVGHFGPVPLRADMLIVDGGSALDACVTQVAGELTPWLATVVSGLTRAMHDAEAISYAERFRVLALAEGIGSGSEGAARTLLQAFDASADATRDLSVPDSPTEPPAAVTVTEDACSEVLDALSEELGVRSRVEQFDAAYADMKRAHKAAWRKSQREASPRKPMAR